MDEDVDPMLRVRTDDVLHVRSGAGCYSARDVPSKCWTAVHDREGGGLEHAAHPPVKDESEPLGSIAG